MMNEELRLVDSDQNNIEVSEILITRQTIDEGEISGNLAENIDRGYGIELADPYKGLDPKTLISLARRQLSEFAKLAFSENRFGANDPPERLCYVLNRYQLSPTNGHPLKGFSLVYRTIVVRMIDALRILRSRGVVRSVDAQISASLDQLIVRDEAVLDTGSFEQEAAFWKSADLQYIVQRFGKTIKKVLRDRTKAPNHDLGTLSTFIPIPFITLDLKHKDLEGIRTQALTIINSQEMEKMSEYRNHALDIILSMSDSFYSGPGNLDVRGFLGKGGDELRRNLTSGLSRQYEFLAAALKRGPGKEIRSTVPCREIYLLDALVKVWEELGITSPNIR
ncbi:hypothetical protein OVA24_17470 [Luteolibacter sp. SL250]|uniref:hypothetical protein n=1 Tax=Luteolibacter sp. SL250 TaxID=2995170 RepID=UPI00226FCFF9|nr:hypothetical protein [Luteolibacter sp. SL250]WAC19022.1 hypothetical protein OVA24_17470 [Luteolibacter sp. SL250]